MGYEINAIGLLCKDGEEMTCPDSTGNGIVFYCDRKCAKFEYIKKGTAREFKLPNKWDQDKMEIVDGGTEKRTCGNSHTILHCCPTPRIINLEET